MDADAFRKGGGGGGVYHVADIHMGGERLKIGRPTSTQGGGWVNFFGTFLRTSYMYDP